MVSLASAGRRFDSLMYTIDGMPFYGTIEPLDEAEPASYDFSEGRFLLRVQNSSSLITGMTIIDIAGRRMLVADHDVSFQYNETEYRSHRLFPMNHQVLWKREATVIDPLTKMKKSTGVPQTLGNIWCLIEREEREYLDANLRIREEQKRVVTGSPLLLGDIVDSMIVKRVDQVLGVWIAGIQ